MLLRLLSWLARQPQLKRSLVDKSVVILGQMSRESINQFGPKLDPAHAKFSTYKLVRVREYSV